MMDNNGSDEHDRKDGTGEDDGLAVDNKKQ